MLLLAAACGETRPVPAPACPTWREDVAPLLAQCAGCHDFSDYQTVIGERDAIVARLGPQAADATHAPFASLYPTVKRWAGDCAVKLFQDPIHAAGILDPTSPDFHGQL